MLRQLVICGIAVVGIRYGDARAGTCPHGIIYVDAAAPAVGATGANWATAFPDLQAALACAEPGDQVWVAGGLYKPTAGADRGISFVLESGVAVYGGFAGTETQLSQRQPSVTPGSANVSELSGDVGVVGNGLDNSNHVVVGSGTNATAILDGFLIRRGRDDNGAGAGLLVDGGSPTLRLLRCQQNFALNGGGMAVRGGASPRISDVTFAQNTTGTSGGGLYVLQSSPVLERVTFDDNRSLDIGGGGLASDRSTFACTACTFLGNDVVTAGGQGDGGGLNAFMSTLSFVDALFAGNSALLNGGASATVSGSTTFVNSRFFDNSVNLNGGAIVDGPGAQTTAVNVVFDGNTAGQQGNVWYSSNTGGAIMDVVTITGRAGLGSEIYQENVPNGGRLRNVILWGQLGVPIAGVGSQAATVSNAIVQGGCPPGTTCSNVTMADPQFVDADGADNVPYTTDDDLRLAPTSPARDAGDSANLPGDALDVDRDGNTAEPLPLDLDRRSRVIGAQVDLGAYEYSDVLLGDGFEDPPAP